MTGETLTEVERDLIEKRFGWVPEPETLKLMVAAVQQIIAHRTAALTADLAEARNAMVEYAEGYSNLASSVEVAIEKCKAARPALDLEALPVGDPGLPAAMVANRAINDAVTLLHAALEQPGLGVARIKADALREAAGVIAQSTTIYGRSRSNADLFGQMVHAMGGDIEWQAEQAARRAGNAAPEEDR